MTLAILGSRGIPAKYGGFEAVAETLARNLPLPMYVFCEGRRPSFKFVTYDVVCVYIPIFDKIRLIGEPIYDALSLIWCSLRSDVDKIYLLGYGASPFVLIPRLFGKKVYVNVDGLEWRRAKWGRLSKIALRFLEWFTRFANYKVFDSKAVWQDHNRMYGSHPSFFLPHCIERYDMQEQKQSYYTVVCRLEPENNIGDIMVAHGMSSSKYPLYIAGTINDYARSLMKLKLSNVRFLGRMEGYALKHMRWQCAAYIHGHEVGGTNPSLLEAMSYGNLIFAKDTPYNREVLGDGLYWNTVEDLEQLIRYYEDAPYDSNFIRAYNFERAHEYDSAKIIQEYMKVFGN